MRTRRGHPTVSPLGFASGDSPHKLAHSTRVPPQSVRPKEGRRGAAPRLRVSLRTQCDGRSRAALRSSWLLSHSRGAALLTPDDPNRNDLESKTGSSDECPIFLCCRLSPARVALKLREPAPNEPPSPLGQAHVPRNWFCLFVVSSFSSLFESKRGLGKKETAWTSRLLDLSWCGPLSLCPLLQTC